MEEVPEGTPSGEKEFEELTQHLRDIVEYPEITEEEFHELLSNASRNYGGPLPHRTWSLCPETRDVVPAVVWEKDGKVWITKKCPEGMITDVYYEDAKMYKRFEEWRFDFKIKSYNVENTGVNCPFDCGLCPRHRSHTNLLNIVLTNRCNLSCWYCFPPNEEAVFKFGDVTKLATFEEVANIFQFEHKVEIEGFKGEYSVPSNLYVLTFNNGKAEWTNVTKFLRRKHEGKLKIIKTRTGRTIRTTPEHKFFVYENGEIVKKRADELSPGDELILLWNFQTDESLTEIDLLEAFKELPQEEKEKIYVRGIKNLDLSPLKEKYGNKVYSWMHQDSMPLAAFYELGKVEEEFSLGRDATEHELPSKLKITPSFAKLIGYFISDGHYSNKDLRITVGHKDVEEEIVGILKEVGLPYSFLEWENKTKQIVIGSRLMRLVFKYALKIPEGAPNKRLPKSFLSFPFEAKVALLSGLFNGDGYVVKGERHLNVGYASVSGGLIRDILYLLASLGIFARVYEVPKENMKGANHNLYKLYIAGTDLVKLVELLELRKGHAEKLGELGNRKPARVKKIADFYIDTIEEISEEEYSGYVYDIEVEHESHSFIAADGVLVSNCFFYAKEGQPIYEPTLEQIRMMLRNAKSEQPIGANAVQFTGGEPSLRDDIIEIIKIAKEEGYDHVQFNTDGIRFAFEPELVKRIREAGVNTFYLSFDGVTPKTNWKNHWEIPLIFENVRKAGGPTIVLVPTLIRNVNDHEAGAIINFGLNHLDIVRSVNFQPISLVGRVPKKERQRFRITIPGAIKRIEEQTNGVIAMDDWYPIPIAGHIAKFFEAFAGRRYYMTSHFGCGAATYVFLDEDRVIPISRFLDIEGFVEFLEEKAEEFKKWHHLGRLQKLKLGAQVFLKFKSFYDDKYAPKSFDVLKIMREAFTHGTYEALGEFHYKTLFLGMMHFMDEYNYDVERVERCVIHYAMPDGRIVPFCSFNVIPELYRDKVQNQFSYTWEEWKALHPDWEYQKDKYVRTKEFIEKMKNSELYRKTYIDIKNYFGDGQ